MSNIIEIQHMSKSYGKLLALNDLSLNVEEGDFFGLVGKNGAGKSTTIRTLLGLIAPSAGGANILGMDVTTKRTEILQNVGYLPSEANFYNGFRVRDIIALSAKLRGMDCSETAGELCERLELDVTRRVNELSLGNRKKVGIVCAMQHKPKLYILDEPTSGLDPLMQREFYSILQERNNEGATIFLSSHVLSEIGRYCKHAAILRDGRLVACDSVERLGHTGVKQVSLRGFSGELSIANAANMVAEQDQISFLYNGRSDELIRELAQYSFSDISVTDPDLEEIFMHYYTEGEEQ